MWAEEKIKNLMKGDIESCMERTRSFFASIPYDLENKADWKVEE